MQLKLGSRRRALVAASAVVLLVFLGLLMPGCAIDTHAYLADPHAYLWDGHTVTELPNTLGGTFSEANDVTLDWLSVGPTMRTESRPCVEVGDVPVAEHLGLESAALPSTIWAGGRLGVG